MIVRRESEADTSAVRTVHAAAFASAYPVGRPPESGLVDALRTSSAWLPRLSLVAEVRGATVGHVVCSRASVEPGAHQVLGLGPLSVLPAEQRRGVGTALVHAVLAAADTLDEPLVGLLGDPDYYARFGFLRADSHGIVPPDPQWIEHFQVRTLSAYRPEIRGTFRYPAQFDGL